MARRTSTPEAVEPTTEAPAEVTAETTETKAEVVIDLTAFESAVSAAAEAADSDTGTVPDAEVSAVQAAYRDLTGAKAKNQAKAHINSAMKAAMEDSNIAKARAFMQLSDSLSAPAPKQPREPKAPADPTEGYVSKVAAVQLGYALVTATVPDGVSADWNDKVSAALAAAQPEIDAYQAWAANEDEDKGEAPEVGYVARTALRIASGKAPGAKSTSTFDGPRRDVGSHIKSAFADVASGTFLSVAQIRAHKSAEYGDEAPSAGAISARLFPKSGNCTVEGITPGQGEKGVRGATKA